MGLALEKLPAWPAALNRDEALAYMRIAPKLFDQLDRTGGVSGKKLGRNGEKVYPREQLDQVLTRLFGQSATDTDDEFAGADVG
jgi:hypothetical protein